MRKKTSTESKVLFFSTTDSWKQKILNAELMKFSFSPINFLITNASKLSHSIRETSYSPSLDETFQIPLSSLLILFVCSKIILTKLLEDEATLHFDPGCKRLTNSKKCMKHNEKEESWLAMKPIVNMIQSWYMTVCKTSTRFPSLVAKTKRSMDKPWKIAEPIMEPYATPWEGRQHLQQSRSTLCCWQLVDHVTFLPIFKPTTWSECEVLLVFFSNVFIDPSRQSMWLLDVLQEEMIVESSNLASLLT